MSIRVPRANRSKRHRGAGIVIGLVRYRSNLLCHESRVTAQPVDGIQAMRQFWSKSRSFFQVAQAMRASLLASATAALL